MGREAVFLKELLSEYMMKIKDASIRGKYRGAEGATESKRAGESVKLKRDHEDVFALYVTAERKINEGAEYRGGDAHFE